MKKRFSLIFKSQTFKYNIPLIINSPVARIRIHIFTKFKLSKGNSVEIILNSVSPACCRRLLELSSPSINTGENIYPLYVDGLIRRRTAICRM